MTCEQVQTDHAPAPAGAYPAAVRVGPFLQASGQLGRGVLVEVDAQAVLPERTS